MIIVIGLTIIFTPINNNYLFSFLFMFLTLFFMFNYFNNYNFLYKRELYIFWSLLAILLVIFFFNIVNILLCMCLSLGLFIQFNKLKVNKQKKNIEMEPEKQEVKLTKTIVKIDLPKSFDEKKFYNIAKKLYYDVQKGFMDFEYDKLKLILNDNIYNQFEKQMKSLQNSGRRAIRDNIEIKDFKITKFVDNINNILVTVNMGIVEDKYTIKIAEPHKVNCRYETYYEIVFKKSNDWIIESLNLINSRSKKN